MKKEWKKLAAFGLTVCLVFTGGLVRTAASQTEDPSQLAEPVVTEDDSLSTGIRTEWTCITFGAYPQTEVVGDEFSAVDDYAIQEGDVLKDPDLYQKLTEANWENNETVIDDSRYLRMGTEDTVNWSLDNEQHYRWGSKEEWHYFRYDPIRWRVADLEDDGSAFLIADRLLDCQPFNSKSGPVAWETSTVRSWLNGLSADQNTAGTDYQGSGFLDRAFSDTERQAILATDCQNKPNAYYGTDCGKDTQDYVFLLSNDQVFASDAAAEYGFYNHSGKDDPAKRFKSTMYAKCRGAWWSPVEGYKGNSFWFMRTSGYTPESVTYICDFGFIYNRGTITTCEDAGLLLGIRIDLNKADWKAAGTVSSKDITIAPASAEESAKTEKYQVKNPVLAVDSRTPGEKEVIYSTVWFGSYPQEEVTAEAKEGEDASGADPELYKKLQEAEWTDDETVIDGSTYRRILPADGGEEKARYFACQPLRWRVLEVRDGRALLLADAAICRVPYNEKLEDVNWENCSLRSWLNGYGPEMNKAGLDYSAEGKSFLSTAFSTEEQQAILAETVRNQDNYYFGTDSGADTIDKIFIPAESEVFMHDSSVVHGFSRYDEVADTARRFAPTDYARAQGAWVSQSEKTAGISFWMLRTPGYTHSNVVYVDESGCLYNRGILVTCSDICAMPALVLNLDSECWKYGGTITVK